jgi:protein involved in polysaccharide export with SLBB domain
MTALTLTVGICLSVYAGQKTPVCPRECYTYEVPYTIAPPDIIDITAYRLECRSPHTRRLAAQQLCGEHLVRPDGTLSLGPFGSVYITGMTVGQCRMVIERHLSQFSVEAEIWVRIRPYKASFGPPG